MIADEPKSPVSKGKSGSFIGRFKEVNPRKPASEKIVKAIKILFSLKIKYIERKISKNGNIIFVVLKIKGIVFKNIGVNKIIIKIPDIEPYKVKTIASCAFPSFNIWCPGSTERKLSSSGTPRKIEGMKSKKV